MDNSIIVKFTIATEQGIEALLFLTQTISREKFSELISVQELEQYLSANFSEPALFVELNSMSNQWLVVYVAGKPAGYARITSKGERPEALAQKRAIRIANFGILAAFTDPAIKKALWDKCLSVCKAYEAIWINEYSDNPYLSFFETEGFVKQDRDTCAYELPLPSICLVKQA